MASWNPSVPVRDLHGRNRSVIAGLESILDGFDLSGVSNLPLDELRSIRHRLDEVELGLSYGRRMAQGRIDILLCEIDRRSGSGEPAELITLLPDALSNHMRGGGLPRPLPSVELPVFADRIVAELDSILGPTVLGDIASVDAEQLSGYVERLRTAEQEIGHQRREAHRMIDELQEEIIGRYRSGAASVDDLLS